MKLLICLATRGRPAILVDTLHKTLANIWHPDTAITVALDEDDKASIDAVIKLKQETGIGFTVKPREDTIAGKWNRALEEDADLYMPMVDHTVPSTPGFDRLMVEAAQRMEDQFHDGIYAVHTKQANLSFAAYNALSRRWVNLLGEIYPTYFPYWFVDHWTDDLARMINRIGYAAVDYNDTKKPATQEMREPGWWATWYDAAWPLRVEQAEALLVDANLTKAYIQNLHIGWDRVFMRSHWINDSVRQMDRGLTAVSGLSLKDERYQRVRKRAVDMVDELIEGWRGTAPVNYKAVLKPSNIIGNLPRAGAA